MLNLIVLHSMNLCVKVGHVDQTTRNEVGGVGLYSFLAYPGSGMQVIPPKR